MAQEKSFKCSVLELFVAVMKSSTKTSTRLVNVAVACRQKCAKAATSPNKAGSYTSSRSPSMKSRAVSEDAHKNGGDSHQPSRQFDTTIFMLSKFVSGSVCVNT